MNGSSHVYDGPASVAASEFELLGAVASMLIEPPARAPVVLLNAPIPRHPVGRLRERRRGRSWRLRDWDR